jgi:hypothetical protein
LRFDGYVGTPKLLYAIQLSFAPGDVGEFREGENINIIRDAVVFTDLINIGISVLVKPNYPEIDSV